MPTLSELSNQLFRDVDANHQDCVRQLEELERNRMAALAAIPGASAALKPAQRAAADAEVTRDEALVEVDIEQQRAERKAAADRADELRGVEQSFREADAAALKAREQAEEKANAALKADLEKIGADATVNPGAKVLSRRAAERRFDEAVRAAHGAFLKSLATNKNTQVDKFRAALTTEVLDSRIARDRANAKRAEIELLFRRALKAAETEMRAALAGIPGAAVLQTQFDDRRGQIKADCRTREEALFAAFRKAKAELAA